MKSLFLFLLLFLGYCQGNVIQPSFKKQINQKSDMIDSQTKTGVSRTDTAVFGGGCFWCLEAVFQNLKGVIKCESGYSGGTVKNPAYREVCNGTTGHAEAIRITFDPDIITYEQLLEVFWTVHDPTTLNRQGNDSGTQYRSAIFYKDDSQRSQAVSSRDGYGAKLWDDPIVTEITPLKDFYVAEDYHQNYYNENGDNPYCSIVITPKVQKARTKFHSWMKE